MSINTIVSLALAATLGSAGLTEGYTFLTTGMAQAESAFATTQARHEEAAGWVYWLDHGKQPDGPAVLFQEGYLDRAKLDQAKAQMAEATAIGESIKGIARDGDWLLLPATQAQCEALTAAPAPDPNLSCGEKDGAWYLGVYSPAGGAV